MISIPVKNLTFKTWLLIFGIWTLAAISLTTQLYLNYKSTNPDISWLIMLLKQLPAWYLCALLTPIVMYFYDRYPLDTVFWKKNLSSQILLAFVVLFFFSHLRLWATSIFLNRDISQLSFNMYINAYLSQMAWDFAIYSLITVAIFADKSNSKQKQNALYAAEIELRNKELINQLNLAELETLKLQVSPHFLFNTLNTVSSLIRAQENNKAIQMITRLGDFLRTTLYGNHNIFISLAEELKFVDLYLDIESIRFSDRLKIKKNIATESLNIYVPHFILQPIFENAIKHGLTKISEAHIISIATALEHDKLILKIYNEGSLLPQNWKLKNSTGIGLKNVTSRLQKIYGDRSSFSIYNHSDKKGVEVLMTIPLHSHE
ncbi:MAG TPA: histidine kinase [Cyclobacteriaceae bacterium]